MALSVVGYDTNGASSVSLPAGSQQDDVAVVFAYNKTTNTVPSLPAGWTSLNGASAGSQANRIGYRIIQSGDTTSGTWSNATAVAIIVLRDSIGIPYNPAQSAGTGTATTTIALPNIGAGSFLWLVSFAGHTAAGNIDALTTTGMTNLTSGKTNKSVGICHSNALVNSYATANYTADTSGDYMVRTVQFKPLGSIVTYNRRHNTIHRM